MIIWKRTIFEHSNTWLITFETIHTCTHRPHCPRNHNVNCVPNSGRVNSGTEELCPWFIMPSAWQIYCHPNGCEGGALTTEGVAHKQHINKIHKTATKCELRSAFWHENIVAQVEVDVCLQSDLLMMSQVWSHLLLPRGVPQWAKETITNWMLQTTLEIYSEMYTIEPKIVPTFRNAHIFRWQLHLRQHCDYWSMSLSMSTIASQPNQKGRLHVKSK